MARNAPWYIKQAQYARKALVLCDRDRARPYLHSDTSSPFYRYSVYLLDLPWRSCDSCDYPHVASGGQELLQTDALIDAERVFEGADTMMLGQISSPVRQEVYLEAR